MIHVQLAFDWVAFVGGRGNWTGGMIISFGTMTGIGVWPLVVETAWRITESSSWKIGGPCMAKGMSSE